jgi:Glycogen recognition site of AMP-activated protein kinase
MGRPSFILIGVAVFATTPAIGQTDASVGVGVGTVRFPGGSNLGIISVGPALQRIAPGQSFTLGSALSLLPQNEWSAQARVAYWAATPSFDGRWRLAADIALAGTTGGNGGGSSGTGLLIGEVLWIAPNWGIALGGGPTSGWITGALPATAAHGRLRGWWQDRLGLTLLSGSIEPTRLFGTWYTDASAGLEAHRGRVVGRLWTTARVSAVYGSKAAALASAELRLSPTVTLEASGGNVLPDPYQGFPGTAFVSAGVRIHFSQPRTPRVPTGMGPFTVIRRDGSVLVRLRQRGSSTVAIAGDWNGWTRTSLTHVEPDLWEVALPLSSGTYHFTVFIDDTAWTIPAGVPSVQDGMGSLVAVLTVF